MATRGRRALILGAGIAVAVSLLAAATPAPRDTTPAPIADTSTTGAAGNVITGPGGGDAASSTPVTAPLAVVALGDSIPEGANCPNCAPFPQLLASSLSTPDTGAAPVTNLGVSGWTTDDLLTSLTVNPSPETATAVATADVITVTIGANDFNPGQDAVAAGTCGGPDNLACQAGVLPQLQTNLGAILDAISVLRGAAPVTVLVTGYWNVFPDGDVAAAQYGPAFHHDSTALTAQANSVIAATALTHHATYIDLGASLAAAETTPGDITALLADDGDHLSQAGHDAIANTLHTAVTTTPRLQVAAR